MKKLIALSIAVLMGAASVSYAASVIIEAEVVKTLVADQDRWGGCMIRIDHNLSEDGLNCPAAWVSFSCSGTFTTKDIAYRMFDSAQMAFALGKKVKIHVDDTKKHNGYCYAAYILVQP
jgi:hypothetical protein